MSADFESDFFAIYHDGLVLQVWLPGFLGVALAKADIVAKLFAFASKIAFIH